jgi:NAD(P)-dependent dehydrogenase (short-subunit alcohol dehydrogenase family)
MPYAAEGARPTGHPGPSARAQATTRLFPWALAGAGALCLYVWARRVREYDLHGKVVLITGGSRGFGLVMARRFVALGARVAVMARDGQEVARAARSLAPGAALPVVGDVGRPDDCEGAVAQTVEHFGRLDVLVNNAGAILGAPLSRTRLEDFAALMDVHFWGTLHMTQAALPHLQARHGSRIVNICSIGAKIAVPHLAAYCASKFAQAGLSSVMAEELRESGVIVTSVFPGLMRTGSHLQARFRGDVRREFALFALVNGLPGTSMGAERAARTVVSAMQRGDAEVVLPWSVRQAARVSALAPNVTARLLAGVSAWLPDADGTRPGTVRGADLPLPNLVRAAITLAERAALRNNQRARSRR